MNSVSTPTHIMLTDFLSKEDHATLLDWAISHEGDYTPSLVDGGEKTAARQSSTLKDFGPCKDIIRSAIKPILNDLGAHFGLKFGAEQKFDASFTAHNDGAYYKPHTDVGGLHNRNRALSMVYYFFRTPARFSGGELRVFRLDRPGEFVDVPPQDNALAVFPAMIPHEVRPVSCPSKAHSDSRFAINVWAHKTAES